MKNYYKIIGVRLNSTDMEIKHAYRQLAKTLHPDLNPSPEAASLLADLNEAYEVLSDPKKRAEYNKAVNNMILQRDNVRSNPGPQSTKANGGPVPKSPYGARFDAAAQMMAANQRAQVEAAVKQSYNDGYAKGYSDATAKADAENMKLRDEITQFKIKIGEYEKELKYTEMDFIDQAEKISEIFAANEKLTLQTKEAIIAEKDREYGAVIEKLRFEINVLKTHLERANVKITEAENELSKKQAKLDSDFIEIEKLKEQIGDYEEYVQSKSNDEDVERIILEREIKLKEEKKLYKNTCYGALGIMYWATNDEIEANYIKLSTRLQAKEDNGDESATAKLKLVNEAYSLLMDDEARKTYNLTLEITDKDIERERELEKQYNLIVEKYEINKSESAFWEYVDELMMLAQSGDNDAQNTLGEMYLDGSEIAKDEEQALYWFKEAAKHQHVDALYNLGQCFYYGEGTKADKAKGEGFIKQAAKLGSKDAAAFLKKN